MSPETQMTNAPRYYTYDEYRKKFYGSEDDTKGVEDKIDSDPASFGRRIVHEEKGER